MDRQNQSKKADLSEDRPLDSIDGLGSETDGLRKVDQPDLLDIHYFCDFLFS